MGILFSRPLWFALARLPFRKGSRPHTPLPRPPVWGQGQLARVPAGGCTMDSMGCEMLAVCNALHFAGAPVPLEDVLRTYVCRRWLLLGGRWGADPYAAGRYFRERGIPFAAFSGKRRFSAFAHDLLRSGDGVAVLSYWLGDTVFSGAHAVTLVLRAGRLWVCNLYNGQTGPLPMDDLAALCPPHRFIVGYVLK